MKIFVRKEFPLYKPKSGGWFTCEVNPLSADDDLVLKEDLLYKKEDESFYDANLEKIYPYFFYEETDAYIPKGEGFDDLQKQIIELNRRLNEVEINVMTPMTPPLEITVSKLHAIVDKMINMMESPISTIHPEAYKLREKLNQISGGVNPTDQIY